jgi:acetyl-CoA acetyltransferase
MREVVIVDAVRTPIGRYNGALKDVRPDDLGAVVIKALVERNPTLLTGEIEEVVLGNANQACWRGSLLKWRGLRLTVFVVQDSTRLCMLLGPSQWEKAIFTLRAEPKV